MTALLEKQDIQKFDWTFSDVADLDKQSKGSDPLVYEKEVIYAGRHYMGDDGFDVDRSDIDYWLSINQEMMNDGIEHPLPVEHTRSPLANQGKLLGWEAKRDSKNRYGLFMKLKFKNEKAAELAETSQVSLKCPKQIKRGGKVYKRGFEHVCFTDYPCVLGLDGFTKLQLSMPPVETGEGLLSAFTELKNEGSLTDEQFNVLVSKIDLPETVSLEDTMSKTLSDLTPEEIASHCPECQKRRKMSDERKRNREKRKKEMLTKEELFHFSEMSLARSYGEEAARETGVDFVAVERDETVLVLAETVADVMGYEPVLTFEPVAV